MPFKRSSGILLHPTSLPAGHGIGDLGKSAFAFVDFLEKSGMGVWQVLPLGPTGGANSPYQALSSYAGNPLLISLEKLTEQGLLTPPDLAGEKFDEGSVKFDRVRVFKEKSLRQAFAAFEAGKGLPALRKEFETFREQQGEWLADFSLFMALKVEHGGKAWFQWPDAGLVAHEKAACEKACGELREEVDFQAFCQFLFFSQWNALRAYANERGIRLMGDVPIYVAHDSADVWAASQFFKLDAKGHTTSVAGVPPDYFSSTGQLWGNPIYKWDVIAADNFKWWIERIRRTLALVDMLRIDHFRGFRQYWEVPAGEKTAINGEWVDGPDDAFFDALLEELGELPIIAEDLGVITEDVNALRERQGLPGMKVLQFAFCDGAEMYLPHTYESNCVVYTATHDNDTTRGWYEAAGEDYEHHDRETIEREHDKARRYLAVDGSDMTYSLIRLAMMSVADTAIFPMQDILNLPNDARMNRPGISDGQWSWRMTGEQFASAPADYLRELGWLYGRVGE